MTGAVYKNRKAVKPNIFTIVIMYSGLFLRGENFHKLSYSQLFKGKFSRIVTDCKEYLLKSKHFKGTDCFRFVKTAKIFPLKNNPLYGK